MGFLEPRLREPGRCSLRTGRCISISTTARRTTASCSLDEVFGRDAFLNELIWTYDYGAKPRRRWPAKHDTILVYVRRRVLIGSTRMPSSASRTWRRAS